MAAKKSPVVSIPLGQVKLNFERNFARERNVETYDDPMMRQDMAQRGQITVAKLLKLGPDLYEPIQGNRRTFNMQKLAEQQVEDPTTCKLDEKGDVIPGTGKPFSTIQAVVYEGLTERERVDLMADHGNVRGLTRAELQLFIEGLFDVGYAEREVARLAGGLLTQHYPPKREIKPIDEDKGADFLANYRGVIQAAKNRWRSPKVLHEQAMQVLRGKQNWPTKAEISEGLKIHETEVDADRTGKLDRETTGPKFNEWYAKLLKAKNPDGEADGGGGKPRPVSMFNRSQIEDSAKVADSRIAKWFHYFFLRDDRIKGDTLPVVCKLLKKIESGSAWTPDDIAGFDACWNAEAVVTGDGEQKSESEILDEDPGEEQADDAA